MHWCIETICFSIVSAHVVFIVDMCVCPLPQSICVLIHPNGIAVVAYQEANGLRHSSQTVINELTA